MPTPTLDQLRKALQISEQIASLKVDFASFFGGTVDVPALVMAAPIAKAKKRRMSAKARARIAAAQRARWAKSKGAQPSPAIETAPVAKPKKKGVMSAEGRARIVAAQKKRWAKVNAAKSTAAPVE